MKEHIKLTDVPSTDALTIKCLISDQNALLGQILSSQKTLSESVQTLMEGINGLMVMIENNRGSKPLN